MFSRRFNVQICLLIVAASLFIVGCGVQRVMGVQGVLLDDNGDPLNGTFSMTFDYCTKASGDCESSFTQTKDVVVTNGLFDAEVGAASVAANADPDPSIFAEQLFLEITIEGETLTPRQKLTGSPYAMSLAGGAIVSSIHNGDGTDDTDENYASLSTIALGTRGTSLLVAARDNGGDLIRGCTAGAATGRDCTNLEFNVKNNGDVAQARAADGLAKAAAVVNCNDTAPSVIRSFNQVNGEAPTVTGGDSNGVCVIDFNFQIDDRFFSVVPLAAPNFDRSVNCRTVGTDQLECNRHNSITGEGADGHISIIIH